ncbi:MAG: metallophosphoesterase family protein [Chitinophagaceae bacterium]
MANTLQRRKFMKLLSGTSLVLTGIPLAATAKGLANEGNGQAPASGKQDNTGTADSYNFLTKPYLQNPEPDAMSIYWLVNRPSHSWVECWEEGKEKKKGETVISGMVVAQNRMNRIRVEGLKANTVYNYRVFSKEIITFEPYKKVFGETLTSDTYQFTTPDPSADKVSLLILNDIHDRPQSFSQLEKLNGGDHYDMVFLNGDMFDHQNNEQQLVDHLIQPCCDVFATKTPFLFVRGNHETRGVFSYELGNYFENMGRSPYFTFKRGPVFFIALDTGEDKEDNHEAYYGLAAFDAFREKQAAWLDQVLQQKEARKAAYRVVLMHIPLFHSGDWHGTMHCRKVFAPLFEKYKVDMVISGHTHRYGVHEPQAEHSYPIIIGGGPKDGNRTIIKLKADKEQLSINMIADNGTQVGEYKLKPRR